MSPVAVPADRRFRRAHVKPARARRLGRTLIARSARHVIVVTLLVYVAYRMPDLAAATHALRIERILVRGNSRVSTGEVLALLNGLRGQSLIWADLEECRQRMLSSPWVGDVEIRRSLPSTIEVFVSEKEPLGIARLDGRLYLMDERGTLIDEYGPQYAAIDLPVIDGLSDADGAGSSIDARRVALASQVIVALRSQQDVGRRLSQVDVRDVHNAAVILSGDAAVIRLGDQRFLQRLRSYLDVAPALRERVPDIDHVDVRFDGRIFVKPMTRAVKSASSSANAKR